MDRLSIRCRLAGDPLPTQLQPPNRFNQSRSDHFGNSCLVDEFVHKLLLR